MQETKWAYLAGIIDGEGYIGVNINRSRPNRRASERYQPELVITNTDLRLMDWLRERFGGSVSIKPTAKAHHRVGYRWKIGDTKAAEILANVLPHLLLKRRQAELVIELVRRRLPRPLGKGAKLQPAELARRRRIYEALRLLNGGPPATTERGGTLTG